jgi:hypothetical protein
MKKSSALNITLLMLGAIMFSCGSTTSSLTPSQTPTTQNTTITPTTEQTVTPTTQTPTTVAPTTATPTTQVPTTATPTTVKPTTVTPTTVQTPTTVPPTTQTPTTSEQKPYFSKRQSILLLGQSNMAGRGDLGDVEAIDDDRIFMIRDDSWTKMVEPIHNDKTAAGIGLAASFAKGFVDAFDCEVGLIPGAYGGTSLSDWAVNGTYYNRALEMAKAAQQDSEICAILWHQGESNQNSSSNYATKLKTILDAFISDLKLDEEKLVIVSGELGEFRSEARLNINNALQELKTMYPRYGVATAEGLKSKSDGTHFNSESLRVFGYRYFNIFHKFITGQEYEYNDDPEYYYIGEPRVEPDEGGDEEKPDENEGKVRYEMEGTIVADTYISASNSSAKDKNYANLTYVGTKKDTSRPLFKFNFSNILTYSMFEENKEDGIVEFTFSFYEGATSIQNDTTCNIYGFTPGAGVSDADFNTLTWNKCSASGANKELYRGTAKYIIKDKPFIECDEIEKTSTTITYKVPYSSIAQFVNLEDGDTYGMVVMGFDFNIGGVKYATMENESLPIPRVDFVHYEDK